MKASRFTCGRLTLAGLTSITLLMGTVSTAAMAQLSENDRQALIDLYETTDGENWRFNEGWLGEPGTECDWFGVDCQSNGDFALALSNNRLSGELPPSLAGASGLRALLLSQNDLSGSWALDDGDLPRVLEINLQDNQLETLELADGAAPRLVWLRLSDNQLSDIPQGLEGRQSLSLLDLSHNQLQGPLPDWMGDLSLGKLYLAGNELTGSILPALAAMEDNLEPGDPNTLNKGVLLDLRANQFSGSVTTQAADFSQGIPGWLNLCWNDLQVADPAVNFWLQSEHYTRQFDACFGRTLEAPSLTASGSWYDPDHAGQGLSIMQLDDGQTLVHWFTYAPLEDNSQRQAWMVGSRSIERIGFDELFAYGPIGGSFGEGLPNPVNYEIDILGELNLFWAGEGLTTDQEARTARMADAARERVELTQLTQLAGTTCSNQRPQQWISGAWYDPEASGEGLAVEVLENGQGQVYWFTYEGDDTGNQSWVLGTGEFEDDTLQVDEVLKPSGGYFGAELDPDSIEVTDWGSLSITFNEDGPSELSWDSDLPEYGSGTQQIEQLAAARLADCD